MINTRANTLNSGLTTWKTEHQPSKFDDGDELGGAVSMQEEKGDHSQVGAQPGETQ